MKMMIKHQLWKIDVILIHPHNTAHSSISVSIDNQYAWDHPKWGVLGDTAPVHHYHHDVPILWGTQNDNTQYSSNH